MDRHETATAPRSSQPAAGQQKEQSFAAPGAQARVSALIVNFNTCACLTRCLQALRHATVAGGLQLVVVDNDSIDGSAAAVRARFPDVELIANTVNWGYAAANNQAFARATAPYLLLLNPDTAVEPEAIEQMATFLDAWPDAAAVTANLVASDGASCAYLYDFPTVPTLLLKETALSRLLPGARARLVSAYEMRRQVPDCVATVPQPPGACLMVRRAALDGTLRVVSRRGKGTVVRAEVPCGS